MNFRTTLLAAIAMCSLALPNLVQAQNIIGPSQITASTNIPPLWPSEARFGLSEITNNNTSDATPYRGFVGAENTLGVINFTLDKPYNLTAFHLDNDVNVERESVKDFTLTFFNAANSQVGGPLNFTTSLGQAARQNFTFPQVSNVARAEMKINSIYTNTTYPRVEIREASFTGNSQPRGTGAGETTTGTPRPVGTTCPGVGCTDTDYSTCCPPSATFDMAKLFEAKQPNLSGDYYINFLGLGGLDAQMVAYVNYLKALDPAFKGLAMSVRIFDGGTGPSAMASGPQLEPDSAIYWNAGTSSGALWPNSSFFSPTTTRPINNWVVIEMIVWTQGPGRGYSQNCERRYLKYRPNMVNGRIAAGAGSGFSAYTGPAPAASAQRPTQRR
jgi:hypothetical protein